jgi:hypothetical protein
MEHAEWRMLRSFSRLGPFSPQFLSNPPKEVVDLLGWLSSEFEAMAERHQVEKIETVGDAYMVVAGVRTTL